MEELKMEDFLSLHLGFNDAENYRRRENKELFNQIFVVSSILDEIVASNTFFLMGEKGTGKTAYAVYITNNTHRDTSSLLTFIRETEYQQFVALKERNHLFLSDYTNIWKVIIYLLISEKISQDKNESSIFSFTKFRNLKNAIDHYYSRAFSPEIIQAMSFVDKTSISAKLLAQYAEVGGETGIELTFSESRFQTNLLFIQRKFEDALRAIKLNKNHILFIDGIDIRPSSIEYEDYLACVKGLANAVWSINNDFFANIKDSQGRLKVVLLVRPDIFDSLGLQNQNNKIRDNSVLLNWQTTYDEYRGSMLFKLADKLLRSQQSSSLPLGVAWDYYFPYVTKSTSRHRDFDASFISFLRYSYYRPRDIVTMLRFLQENLNEERRDNQLLTEEDFDSSRFRRKLANYLLGEVKDQLSFYYSSEDYETFLKFFQYLKGGMKFDYADYLNAYKQIEEFLQRNNHPIPSFLETSDVFLQFLYELNVISYIEDPIDFRHQPFISWCFRERTTSNISPKIKQDVRYEIHYGLARALRIGKRLVR
ncbi:MAG TPA: funZ protein [Anaerolineae bacterium]|nr:funZ protein [Anaerolineae bacterium]